MASFSGRVSGSRPKQPSLTGPETGAETCTICQSTYSDPRLLPCLHSFCRSCLERLSTSTPRKIKCPLCRTEHSLQSGGVAKLLPDTQAASKASLPASKCGQCQSQSVVSFCSECETFLCNLCHQAHGRMAIFQTHMVVAPTEANMKPKPKSFKCSKHPKESLDVYCIPCKSVICRDCALYLHNGHKFKPGEEASEEIKKRLISNRDLLKSRLETFRSHAETVATTEKHVTTYPDKMKAFITSHFDSLKLQLDQRKNVLLMEVDAKYHGFSKTLYVEKDTVEMAICKLEAGIKFADRLLGSTEKLEISILGTQVLSSMKDSQKLFWDPSAIENISPLVYVATKENYSRKSKDEDLIQNMGLLKHVSGIELQLTRRGYHRHTGRVASKTSVNFEKNGTYHIEALLTCDQVKTVIDQMNISCTCDGPKSLARSTKKPIACTVSPNTKHLQAAEKWEITFQTAEPGDYTVTVKLYVHKEEYCEKVDTIKFIESGQVHTTISYSVHTTSYSQQPYDTQVTQHYLSQPIATNNFEAVENNDEDYDNHYDDEDYDNHYYDDYDYGYYDPDN